MIKSSECDTVSSNLMNTADLSGHFIPHCVYRHFLRVAYQYHRRGEGEVMEVVMKAHHGILSNKKHNCSIEFIISSHPPVHFFLPRIYYTEAPRRRFTKRTRILHYQIPNSKKRLPRVPAFRCSRLCKEWTFTISFNMSNLSTCRALPLHVRLTL